MTTAAPAPREWNRRQVLLGGGLLLGAALSGRDGRSGPAPAGDHVTIERGVLQSRFWPGRDASWAVVKPARFSALVIALHPLGASSRLFTDRLDAAGVARRTGLAIAAIDGGSSYWHPRTDGIDTSAMVLRDFLPMLADRGLPTGRIGLTGISMGGYGALRMATLLPPERVAGVAVVAPAVRRRLGENYTRAFDNVAQFDANNPLAHVAELRRVPVCIACGRSDRFYRASAALAAELPQAVTLFDSGSHTSAYVRDHWEPVMQWLGFVAGGEVTA